MQAIFTPSSFENKDVSEQKLLYIMLKAMKRTYKVNNNSYLPYLYAGTQSELQTLKPTDVFQYC